MKKIFIFGIIIIALLAVHFVSAEYELEVKYPEIKGLKAEGTLTGYIRYLYTFGLAIISIAALGALVYGGLMYMTAETITTTEEAKRWIWGAVTGLLLGFGAYLILNTINPDLVSLKPPNTPPPSSSGWYTCSSTGGDWTSFEECQANCPNGTCTPAPGECYYCPSNTTYYLDRSACNNACSQTCETPPPDYCNHLR
jgi:hypothetical protein